jgi:Bax protein
MSRLWFASVLCLGLICCVGESSESVPDFAKIKNTSERKQAFFCYLAPMLRKENDRLLQDRERLVKILGQEEKGQKPGASDRGFVEGLAKDYGLKTSTVDEGNVKRLLVHVDEVPVSLGLAQGANESAWGTSRFAREGHNFFGQWCFEKGCGLVPEKRPEGQTYEVRRFRNAQDSVNAFMLNLNQNARYESLRAIRAEERKRGEAPSGVALAEGLRGYSARGEEYVHTLQSMIRFNDLTRFDSASGIKKACESQETHARSRLGGVGENDPA